MSDRSSIICRNPTLIVVGAGAATLLLRRHSARWRYWLWSAASMNFLVPFALLAALGAQVAWRAAPVDDAQREWQEVARQVFALSAVFRRRDLDSVGRIRVAYDGLSRN